MSRAASLQELREEYYDFLRVRRLSPWSKDSREARFVRKLGATPNASYDTYRKYIDRRSSEVVANILVCLIHQTNYLLDQQLRQLEKEFLLTGGLRERMFEARQRRRQQRTGRKKPR